MSTNFGLAGIPGTRLKVPVWVVVVVVVMVGGSHTHYCITPFPRLGAGALMLNAWASLIEQKSTQLLHLNKFSWYFS